LFAALEHNRIDRIASAWYDRDMVAASAKHIECISAGSNILAQELLGMLYGKPLSGGFPILEKYKENIEAAVKSSSPVKAVQTAIAMANEAGGSTYNPRLPVLLEPAAFSEPTEKGILDVPEEHGEIVVSPAKKEEVRFEGNGNHQYRVCYPEMIPFEGMEFCSYVLNQWTASKPLYKTATHGAPRNNVWAINHGKTRVFNKRVVSAGKIVVLVDLSSSMISFSSARQPGYLAFLAANLVAGSAGGSDVDLYGFTGDSKENFIIPIEAGYVLDESMGWFGNPALVRLTPMCVALTFLSTTYQSADASIAVLITDGRPSEASGMSREHVVEHTRELAYSLYEAGMRYLLIQVKTEGLEQLYPAEITLHVDCKEDLFQIPMAMSAMGG